MSARSNRPFGSSSSASSPATSSVSSRSSIDWSRRSRRRSTGGICFGAVDRLLALLHDALGESDRTDAYFARAVEQHHRLRSPTWVARTELDWAESLIARDRLDDAREHLTAAEAAIGDLDLADSTQRLAALHARL